MLWIYLSKQEGNFETDEISETWTKFLVNRKGKVIDRFNADVWPKKFEYKLLR